MLDSLRTHAKGWLGRFIVIGISLTFALFGLQSYTANSNAEKSLVTVGDKEIYQAELNNAYQQRLVQLKQQYGEQFKIEMVNEQVLRQEVLNRLIQENLVINAVEEQGYQASDAAVLNEIAKIQAFQKDKEFDKETYTRLLTARGMSSAGFVSKIKQGLERDQFIQGIVNTTLVDDSQVEDFYRINMQTRDLKFLLLPLSGVLDSVEFSEEAVNSFYIDNEYLFKTEEKVSVNYIELKLSDLMSDIEVSEQELVAFYEAEKDSFTSVAKRRASHIMFEAPRDAEQLTLNEKRLQAEKILVRIKGGEDFSMLAKEFSDDSGSAKSGGDLGNISSGMMDDAFESALGQLKEGEVSEVIMTEFGYHIIKLTELAPAITESYEVVKSRVEKAYKQEIAGEKFYQIAEQINELAFEMPDSLDVLVDQLTLEQQSTTLFSRSEGKALADNSKVREAAFSVDVLAGNNSEVIEISQEHLLVLRVNDHQIAATKPLAEVREMVELAVKSKIARQQLKKTSDELLSQLKSGEKLVNLAASSGFEITDVGPITRNETTAPAEVVQDAFGMSKPAEEVVDFKTSLLANGDIAIIELSKVVDGDVEKMPTAESDSIKQFLERLQSEVVLSSTIASLSGEAGVNIHTNSEMAQ